MAEEAVNIADLDVDELKQQAANLNEDLELAKEAVDKARVRKRIALVNAKLEAVAA